MIKEPLMTLAEVAEELGITENMAFRIERKAINKLRAEFKKRGISFYDFIEYINENLNNIPNTIIDSDCNENVID